MTTKLGYYLFRFLLWVFSLMPFWWVYRCSDLLFLLLYYVVGYRRKVVRNNLKNAFPEWTKQQLKKTEIAFYRHLADIFLEGIKGISLSDAETVRRYKIISPEAPNQPYNEGKASLFVGSHYNNWEYGALGCGLQVEPRVIIFYKPVKNKLIDDYIRNKRDLKGSILAPISHTAQFFQEFYPEKPMYIMLADQSPSNVRECHWTEFFGRDTAVLHGPAKYAQTYNLPIYIIRTRKVKRGFYEVSGELIHSNPNDCQAEEISRLFMQKIEELIREAPQYWLWSHKRWKKQRPEK